MDGDQDRLEAEALRRGLLINIVGPFPPGTTSRWLSRIYTPGDPLGPHVLMVIADDLFTLTERLLAAILAMSPERRA